MKDYDRFPEVKDALKKGLEDEIEALAKEVAASIQSAIQSDDLVKTGNLMESVYYKTAKTSTYPGEAGNDLLPEMPAPESSTEADIGPAASYAIYQDMGTIHIPARPFMQPGLDAMHDTIIERLTHIDALIEKGGYRA